MGNGESTSRRVSMQRSDDGSIQIAENVLYRLNKQKPSKPDNEVTLDPGEIVMQESEVKKMLDTAYSKGKNTAIAKLQAEKDKEAEERRLADGEREAHHKQQIKQLAEYWREQFELETSKVRDMSMEDNEAFEKLQAELSERRETLLAEKVGLDQEKQVMDQEKQVLNQEKQVLEQEKEVLSLEKQVLDQEKQHVFEEKSTLDSFKETLSVEKETLDAGIDNLSGEKTSLDAVKQSLEDARASLDEQLETLSKERQKIREEKSQVDQEKDSLEITKKEMDGQLRDRESQLNEEFQKIADEVDKKIRPLQKASICSEVQEKVLNCYRQNGKQPLRCAAEVQEFVNCVQEARLRMMQKKLTR